jgi:GT2 family glycosyltransferase
MTIDFTASKTPEASIVLVCWNCRTYLRSCLDALDKQTHKDFEVIIVDNGSTDGSLEGIEAAFPSLALTVRRLPSNLGFASANNVGAEMARGRWLVLLNTDAMPEPAWLENLVSAARVEDHAFLASRQLQAKAPHLLDGEGDVYHISGVAWRRNYGIPVYPESARRQAFSACGAAALYPRDAFLAAGGFDVDYFAYLEDVDLGFRLRLRGFRCLVIPDAVVHHVGSASTGNASDFVIYHGHRNLVWTFFKDMPGPLLWLYLPLHILMNLYSLLAFTVRGRAGVIFRAKWDAVRGLPTMLRKRRSAQAGRTASSSEIRRAMRHNLIEPFRGWRLHRRLS